MPKRIALFILGVVLAVGAFLLYQHFTGASVGNGYKLRPPPPGVATTQPMSIESRDDATGRLRYAITAPASPVQIKDASGNPLPGQFRVEQPVATFYLENGRTVQVRADTCEILLAQPPSAGALPGLGVKGAGAMPRGAPKIELEQLTGTMSGHVRLVLSPKVGESPASVPGAAASLSAVGGASGSSTKDAFPDGLRLYFDGPVKLEGNNERLTSGPFHIRSSTLEADLQDMTLVFSRKRKDPSKPESSLSLETLRIEQNPNGNELIVRNLGSKAQEIMDGSADKKDAGAQVAIAAPGGSVPATAPKAGPAKPPKEEPPVYRMSFGQNVRAAANKSSLSSERLYLIFKPSGDVGAAGGDNAAATAPNGLAAGPLSPLSAATQPAIPDDPGPLRPAGPEDLVVTWDGALETRPLEDDSIKLAGGNDIMLEAVGTAAKPVWVTSEKTEKAAPDKPARLSQIEVQSGVLKYRPNHPISLATGDFGKVLLMNLLKDQTGEIRRTDVESLADLTIDDKDAFFAGAGRLASVSHEMETVKQKDAARQVQVVKTTLVNWKQGMDLKLETPVDPKDPKKKLSPQVREAKLFGADIHADTFDLAGDVLDVKIASLAKGDVMTQSLEYLLATGNVGVKAYTLVKDAAGVRTGTRTETGGMLSQRMEILTAIPQGAVAGAMPVPSQLIAEGDVKAWRLSENGKDPFAAAAGAGAPAGGNPDKVKKTRIDTLYTPKFIAELNPKPATGLAAAPANESDTGFAAMGQDVEVSRFLADDARIEIKMSEANESRLVTASANLLEARPVEGTASLTAVAKPGIALTPVRVATGNNFILGNAIDLRFLENEQMFLVKGPGEAHLLLPPENAAKASKSTTKAADKAKPSDPTPLLVNWKDSMSFDNVKHLAIFTGSPVATVPTDKPELANLANLSCDKTLTVQLKPGTGTSADPLAGNLALDWIEAVGNVNAHGAKLGAKDDKPGARDELLTDMWVTAKDVPQIAGRPGRLGILRYLDESQTIEIPGPGDLAVHDYRVQKVGESRMPGTSGFEWQGSLKFAGDALTFSQGVIFAFQPNKPFPFLSSQPAAMPAGAPASKPVPAILQTELLTATLTTKEQAGKTMASPIRIGDGGNLDVSNVVAKNGAMLLVGPYTLNGGALTFDVPKNVATVTGVGNEPVFFSKSGESQVEGTKITLDMTKDQNFLSVENPKAIITGAQGK